MQFANPKPNTASGLARESYGFLKTHLRSLGVIAVFPITLSVLIGVASQIAVSSGVPRSLSVPTESVLAVLPGTLFGVAWHRLVLAGQPSSISVSMTWSSAHNIFALFLVFWRVPWLLIGKLEPESVGPLGYLLFVLTSFVLVAYLQARFSLFLPAAAIGKALTPGQAWQRSRGYVGVIFWSGFLAAVFGMVLSIPLLVAAHFLERMSSLVADMSVVVLNNAANLIIEALAVGALSFAYKSISQREGATENEPPSVTG